MRFFLTGATGFVGKTIVPRLLGDGHEVSAWVRDAKRARGSVGAEVILVDAAGADDALADAVSRADVILHLAGEPVAPGRWSRQRRQRIRDSRIGLTERLVAALSRSAKPAVLITASAVGIYGDRGDDLTEDSAAGTGFLADVVRDWEAAAVGYQRGRVVRLRFGVILGEGGGMWASIRPVLDAGLGGPLGSGKQYVPWVHIEDVVAAILRAATDASMSGAYNVVAPQAATMAEVTGAAARALGRPHRLRVPAFALRAALGEAATAVLASQRVAPERLVAAGFEFKFPTLDEAVRDLADPRGVVIRPFVGDAPASRYLGGRRPRYELVQEATVGAPLDEVYAFFAKPENLGAMTPPDLAFAIRAPVPERIEPEASIDYDLRLGRFPLGWRTRIEAWEVGVRFVDVQEKGPYGSWWHEHRFEAVPGGTRMLDRVLYAPPLGILGRLANRLFVAPRLERIFAFRARFAHARFGA